MSNNTKKPPQDEVFARFQLQTERAIRDLEERWMGLHGDLARKVATMTDQFQAMTTELHKQNQQIDECVHQVRQGVNECNLAMKEAAKAAQVASDSAQVYEKLKDMQPDFHRMVREQNEKIARVVDAQTHLGEQLSGLVKRLEEFETVVDGVEETRGELSGLDQAVKKLDLQVRTSRPM
jgi:methyl-accepting chemotaxis protein